MIPIETAASSVTYTGFSNQVGEIKEQQIIDVQLVGGMEMNGVTVYGAGEKSRVSFNSHVPEAQI